MQHRELKNKMIQYIKKYVSTDSENNLAIEYLEESKGLCAGLTIM